jgi:membrane associated rhomboid family serine protease
MRITRRTLPSLCVFFAFTAPVGVVAHLVSEFAGLGWHDDADIIFSARHAYLLAIALAACAGLLIAIQAVAPRKRRERVAALVETLPFHGSGPIFTALSFVTQFAIFAVTQLGEGCPLCDGDVVVGVTAAALAALAGALAISLCRRRILAFACALFERFVATHARAAIATTIARRRIATMRTRRVRFHYRCRPPPAVGAR